MDNQNNQQPYQPEIPASEPSQQPYPQYQQPQYSQNSLNPQQGYQQPVYQQPVYQQPVYQQPIYGQPLRPAGNGCATASLVLSIISVSFLLLAVILISSMSYAAAGFAVLLMVVTPILALVGLSLGIPGVIVGAKRKCKLGVGITGLVLSSVTLLSFIVALSELAYELDRLF